MSNPSSLRLQGRVAIVTGAAQGIGARYAAALAAEGAALVCADVIDAEPVAAQIRATRRDDLGRALAAWTGRPALAGQLDRITAPTRVVIGDADTACPRSRGEVLAAGLHASVTVVPGAGQAHEAARVLLAWRGVHGDIAGALMAQAPITPEAGVAGGWCQDDFIAVQDRPQPILQQGAPFRHGHLQARG